MTHLYSLDMATEDSIFLLISVRCTQQAQKHIKQAQSTAQALRSPVRPAPSSAPSASKVHLECVCSCTQIGVCLHACCLAPASCKRCLFLILIISPVLTCLSISSCTLLSCILVVTSCRPYWQQSTDSNPSKQRVSSTIFVA